MWINPRLRPQTLAMTDNDILRAAPSVFATSPWHEVSDHYRFIPTIEVVNHLREHGFQPISAKQSRTNIPGKGDFTRHMLRFRHENYLGMANVLGNEIPELVMSNAHDRTSTYRFNGGIFVLACTNGLIICKNDFGSLRIRHSGLEDLRKQVIDTTFKVVEQTEKVSEEISVWKALSLPRDRQEDLARSALELVNKPNIKANQLLNARRLAENPDGNGNRSLWATFNVVQENLMKGGLIGYTSTGRRSSTRQIKAVGEELRLNSELWKLADSYAKAS